MLDEDLVAAIGAATQQRFNEIKRTVDARYPDVNCNVEYHRRAGRIDWVLGMSADRDEDELTASIEISPTSAGWIMDGDLLKGSSFLRELEAADLSIGREALLSRIDELFAGAEDVILNELAIQHPES